MDSGKDYSHCDSCVKSVIEKFITRADFGMKKYGTNLDRTDLSLVDWIKSINFEIFLYFQYGKYKNNGNK